MFYEYRNFKKCCNEIVEIALFTKFLLNLVNFLRHQMIIFRPGISHFIHVNFHLPRVRDQVVHSFIEHGLWIGNREYCLNPKKIDKHAIMYWDEFRTSMHLYIIRLSLTIYERDGF